MVSHVFNPLALSSRCIPLWVGARGIEFDWKYIQMSFDSNISLVNPLALTLILLNQIYIYFDFQ